MLADFAATVKDWAGKPDFTKNVKISFLKVSIEVGTENKIYRYVSKGTRDHWVPKEGVATMAFQPGYKPKTTPGVLSSQAGGAFGERIVRRGRWKVRGIKPRHFEKTIARKWRPRFKAEMHLALKEGALASGHAIR